MKWQHVHDKLSNTLSHLEWVGAEDTLNAYCYQTDEEIEIAIQTIALGVTDGGYTQVSSISVTEDSDRLNLSVRVRK